MRESLSLPRSCADFPGGINCPLRVFACGRKNGELGGGVVCEAKVTGGRGQCYGTAVDA